MIRFYRGLPGQDPERSGDLRTRMIADTEGFLNWAMTNGHAVPRIPRTRVDQGGFSGLQARPGGRALINHWWMRTLNAVGR